jgi:Transposase
MTSVKYIGMDVHKESISIAVRNAAGKLVMECVIETKANSLLDFLHGLRGELQVTFEEGTWATWLYDLMKPHVEKLVVCNPRKNNRRGDKNDRIDARELSDLLYMNKLSSVYHGGAGVRTLRELARSYLTISKDLGRVMSRVKAIYRSWGIPCAGKQVYAPRHRSEWLGKITEVGVLRRAEFYYQQLDALRPLRHEVRRELLAESTKRPLWKYSGFAIEMHSSADYRSVKGQLQKSRKRITVRGLNRDCNHDLKNLFKSAATIASVKPGPFQEFYAALLAKGMRPEMARLTLARKIATIVLIVWKRGVRFDAQHLKPQTA